MAEKSILINDQAGGEAIAIRDAYEQDTESNARVIQLMDQANRHFSFLQSAPDRTKTVDDETQLTSTSLANLIAESKIIGDGSALVVGIQFKAYMNGSEAAVSIIPLIFDSADVPIGFLQPKVFRNYVPGNGGNPFYFGTGHPYTNLTMLQTWPLLGGGKIIPFLNKNSHVSSVDIWFEVISGQVAGHKALTDPTYVNTGGWGCMFETGGS